ncbi:Thermophilic serine proteinase [Pontiella desulfatans]|uniref:Thermophilic serine proteinase n=1 Tax=Pontiella desulfatans TaxID=2750659 RepID=A0A6C2TVH6_PONDE|nr:Thermophilic serine proteinase [Pontiella desulfatans]
MLAITTPAATLRIEGEHAWLDAEGAPLSKVLRLFEQRGAEVLIDPALDLGRVSGEWENTKVERLIGQLASPNSYLVEWKRVASPLGDLYQVSRIRIYGKNLSAAQPLSKKSRVLDVVEGKDGVKYIRGEIMVGFGEGATIQDLNQLLRKINGTVVEVIDPPGIYRIKLNEGMSVEEAMAIAMEHPGVETTEPNLAFPSMGNAPLPGMGTGAGMNLNLQPGETAVAVFDSGLDPRYADLPIIRGTYDAVDPSASISDPLGHGTLTALVAAGVITPEGAQAAETGTPVLAIRTFDENGMTSSDTLMRALEFAANSGVQIVNMSWGSDVDSAFMKMAMDYAAQNGMTLFAAAGNEPTGEPIYPAGYDSVIAVGGLNADGSQWEQSNYGDFVDIYAPAKATFNGKGYAGTSIASPFTAGRAAQQ